MNPLHPDHLADLRKSGLTDATIQAAGIYTVPPDEIGQGKNRNGLPDGVVTAMAFPYPGFDGYERFKVWWEKGRTGPKYLAKAGTSNHFYLPSLVDMKGDSHLLLVEGEKKALSLMQAGYQVVGIGGVFNWLNKGDDGDSHPLPDFDLVNWNRPVTILFDSDGADNPNVRLAAWRLAREVAKRGGQVDVLFFPGGANGEKVGADDYLVEHGPEPLTELLKTAWPHDPALNDHEAEINWQLRGITPESELLDKIKALDRLIPILSGMGRTETTAILEGLKDRLKLRAKDLTDLVIDIKSARKHKKKEGSAVPTLDKLQDVRRLHPAIDFPGDSSVLGFRVDLPGDDPVGLLLVIYNGEGVKVEVIMPDRGIEKVEIGEEIYQIKSGAPPFLRDVWGLDKLKLFMAHPTYPKGLYQDLVAAFKTYLDLPEPAYGLMAAWTVGTYFAQLFTAYPFLHFHGPKESGKSKSLEAERHVCFNAWKGRDITPAALGDTADGQRGTLLLDQAEKLNSDKETGNLIGLLADSYKQAGGQRRVVEMTNGGRSVLEFSTYGPKAFASTKPLDPDLADRCVRIPMTRTRRKLPDLEGWEKVWGELRDKLYRFTLAAFKIVRYRYEVNPGNGTRIGELWRPMLAVLLALGVEEGEVESIRTLFMEAAQETRHEPTGWECTLLEVLREEAQAHDDCFEMPVSEILTAMNIEGDKQPGGKWIGDTLSRYHLFQGRRRTKIEGKKETAYQFNPARVKELCEIYLRDPPANDLSHLSPGDNTNDSNGFGGTRENQGTRPHLSPLGTEGHEGHEGTRPPEMLCPLYHTDNVTDNDLGQVGQEKSGGIPEKDFNLLSGEEVEL